jgi:spermidine/putrescine transport system substrate-binding protein
MIKTALIVIMSLFTCNLYAKTVNVYAWGGEIPVQVIHLFEQQTGIKVNFSTYDSNETMYAKLRTNSQGMYDIILPSTYFVERMNNMLLPLDLNKIPNIKHINPFFLTELKPNYYGIPLVWGATGIFYNKKYINKPIKWQDLWHKNYRNQLMLLNDPREVFAMALMSLGYHPQDNNPQHIQQAYQALVNLIPNIKLFANEGVQALMIDSDALLGSAWNGDVFKAHNENSEINFVYPQDGFVIWIDCLAIPKNAPHIEEAYTFINFLLKPEIAAKIALIEGHAITNQDGKDLLPKKIRNNKTIYPSDKTLKRGYMQHDIHADTMSLYHELWQKLKLDF